jgi:hypothetical protein
MAWYLSDPAHNQPIVVRLERKNSRRLDPFP